MWWNGWNNHLKKDKKRRKIAVKKGKNVNFEKRSTLFFKLVQCLLKFQISGSSGVWWLRKLWTNTSFVNLCMKKKHEKCTKNVDSMSKIHFAFSSAAPCCACFLSFSPFFIFFTSYFCYPWAAYVGHSCMVAPQPKYFTFASPVSTLQFDKERQHIFSYISAKIN